MNRSKTTKAYSREEYYTPIAFVYTTIAYYITT